MPFGASEGEGRWPFHGWRRLVEAVIVDVFVLVLVLCCVQVQVCAVKSFNVGSPTQMSPSLHTYPAQANPT